MLWYIETAFKQEVDCAGLVMHNGLCPIKDTRLLSQAGRAHSTWIKQFPASAEQKGKD